jgi:hypothetical protein
MDRVFSFTTFEEERNTNPALAYWITRSHDERIAEVERLRIEYMTNLGGAKRDGNSARLCRSLLVVDRKS